MKRLSGQFQRKACPDLVLVCPFSPLDKILIGNTAKNKSFLNWKLRPKCEKKKTKKTCYFAWKVKFKEVRHNRSGRKSLLPSAALVCTSDLQLILSYLIYAVYQHYAEHISWRIILQPRLLNCNYSKWVKKKYSYLWEKEPPEWRRSARPQLYIVPDWNSETTLVASASF